MRCRGEALCPVELVGIEIDMRVEVANAAFGHSRPLHHLQSQR
jgi:hypothetical protein